MGLCACTHGHRQQSRAFPQVQFSSDDLNTTIEQPPQSQLDQRGYRSGDLASNQHHGRIFSPKLAIALMRNLAHGFVCYQVDIFLAGHGNTE